MENGSFLFCNFCSPVCVWCARARVDGCMCACMRACVRACMCLCVCVCACVACVCVLQGTILVREIVPDSI